MHHPCGAVWWEIWSEAVKFQHCSLQTRRCQQHCAARGVLGVPTGLSAWLGDLGEASWCICGIVFLPVMLTAIPQLSHVCIPTLSQGLTVAFSLCCSGKNASASPVLRAADHVLHSLILTATASSGAAASSGRGCGQSLWLCFSAQQWWLPGSCS